MGTCAYRVTVERNSDTTSLSRKEDRISPSGNENRTSLTRR
jgi:hypothetical protein